MKLFVTNWYWYYKISSKLISTALNFLVHTYITVLFWPFTDFAEGTRVPGGNEDLPYAVHAHVERQQLLDDNLLIINPGSNDVIDSSNDAAALVGVSSRSQWSNLALPHWMDSNTPVLLSSSSRTHERVPHMASPRQQWEVWSLLRNQ